VAELRRLGRLGAYRLGRLGAPAPPPPKPPAPHYPSWVPGHRGPVTAWLLACVAVVAILAAGAVAGWWFLPFVAGLAGGIAARGGRWRRRVAVPAAVLVAAAGWAVPLAWLAAEGRPVSGTARVVAALAGLPAYAAVALALTLLVAVLQMLAGLWLGWCLVPRPRRPLDPR
jgi:hypothetical protein